MDGYRPSYNQNILSQLGIFEISGYARFKYSVYMINSDGDVATDTSRYKNVEILLSRPKMFFFCCFETILKH